MFVYITYVCVSVSGGCPDLMPESHERILRRIIRPFGSFPTTTYSNRIPSDVNVHITYRERSGRVLNLNKTCA